MAEFFHKRKQRDDEVLGSAVDFLLANARLVLGVGGAAILGIATLAVKRVRPDCAVIFGAPRAGAYSGERDNPSLPVICCSTPAASLSLSWMSRLMWYSDLFLCLQLIDRATSPRDEEDVKGDTTCLEESWKELSLLKATPRLQLRSPPSALSQSRPCPAPLPSTPSEWHLLPLTWKVTS